MEEAGRTVKEGVLRTLSGLRGVKSVFYLDEQVRAELARIEKDFSVAGPIAVHNEAVLECLGRQHVAVIVKDRSFRPPPCPTVVLIDDDGKVIGKELIRGEQVQPRPGERLLNLGKDFVIFYDGSRSVNARFVLPPVPFAEVETMEGVERVVSSSPSTVGDLLVRRSAGLDDDPKLATVLIGFDLSR